jgi:hypothetical protein
MMYETAIRELLIILQSNVAQRRFGKTYAAATLAARTDGTVICFSEQEARRVAETYGVKTERLDTNRRGRTADRPIILDQTTAEYALEYLLSRISKLDAELYSRDQESSKLKLQLAKKAKKKSKKKATK